MKVHGVAFRKPFPLGGTNQPNPQGRRKDKCKETLSQGSWGYFLLVFLTKRSQYQGTERTGQRASLGTEGWGRSQISSCNMGFLKTLQLTCSLCQAEQLSVSLSLLSTFQVSPCFLSLSPHLTPCVPPRRARQLSSLPKRFLPGFKSQSKLHLNNTEQISSTAFPLHEYFIRLLGAKPVGGGIKLTARTHGC